MTYLDAVQEAAYEVGVNPIPSSVFGVEERTASELRILSHKVVEDLIKEHPWSKLTKIETLTTSDDTPTADQSEFSLPTDFDRFSRSASQIWTTRLSAPLARVRSVDTWIELDINSDTLSGEWIYYGGKIRVRPIVASNETLQYAYQSTHAVQTTADGATKPRFTADDDVFLLPSRLLTLALIWRWRSKKGMGYAEDLEIYQDALADEIAADKPGDHIIRIGEHRRHPGVTHAYPFNLIE